MGNLSVVQNYSSITALKSYNHVLLRKSLSGFESRKVNFVVGNETGTLQIGVEKSASCEKFKTENKSPLLANKSYLISPYHEGWAS